MTEEGRVLRVIATPIAPMRKAADANSGLVTEALLGERVQVEDSDDAFVKAELEEDGYVGYLPRAMLGAPEGRRATGSPLPRPSGSADRTSSRRRSVRSISIAGSR